MLKSVFIVAVVLINYQLCLSKDFRDECCIKFPKAMDIGKFQTMVATGEDWLGLFSYVCPFDAAFAATEQFRVSLNMTTGDLKRRINLRRENGAPCFGVFNETFEQVGTKKAVFRSESGGLIREDRYLDTGSLADYYILFTCRDRASARKGRCFNYFVAIHIREDPPKNFPWDKVMKDLKRLGIRARDIDFDYVDESDDKPMVFQRAHNVEMTSY